MILTLLTNLTFNCFLFFRNQVPQNHRQSSKLGLQNFRGTEVIGHHDYSEKGFATQLTMSRMVEGDASLLVLHKDLLPEKSFSVEGRLSGVRFIRLIVPGIQETV